MKTVIFQKKAIKQLKKIPDRLLIYDKCTKELLYFPYCRNVKALTNHKYPFRYRVGNYRVFFELVGETMNIISIEEVKKRDERTY